LEFIIFFFLYFKKHPFFDRKNWDLQSKN
jgi:hypothetical protein